MLEQARAGAVGHSSYSNNHGVERDGEKKGVDGYGSGGNLTAAASGGGSGYGGGGNFGELGTAGATRRVVFRPSNPHHQGGGNGGGGKR